MFRHFTLALGVSLFATGINSQEAKYFEVNYELHPEVQNESGAQNKPTQATKKPTQFWRIETAKGSRNVQIFDLCNEGRLLANATGNKDQWEIKSQQGNQTGKVDPQGNFSITVDKRNDKGLPESILYATGHEIEPVECKDGMPTKQIQLRVPPLTETSTNSGLAHLKEAIGKTLTVIRQVSPTVARKETQEKVAAGTLVCKSAPMTERAVRDLSDAPAFSHEDEMWPGNLIQGEPFSEGTIAKWVPINWPRKGGEIRISGLTFKGDGVYSAKLDEITAATVQDAIKRLIGQPLTAVASAAELKKKKKLSNQPSTGVAATVSWNVKQVYSNAELVFQLGADARYMNTKMNSDLKIETTKNENFVLARFQQIYYYASFTKPAFPWSVFKDDKNFEDGDPDFPGLEAISASNPPLYVSKVGYGRAIYFLAKSKQDASAIQASLTAAYEDATGISVGTENRSNYEKVMAETEISYFALGGSAKEAAKPINTTGPKQMFAEIKRIIADLDVINGVGDGVPLSYNLNYLIGNAPATMGYATAYDLRDCEILSTNFYTFVIEHLCVDDRLTMDIYEFQKGTPDNKGLRLGGKPINTFGSDTNYKVPAEDSLLGMANENPNDRSYILEMRLQNYGGPSCHTFRLKREKLGEKDEYLQENMRKWGPKPVEFRTGGSWNIGQVASFGMSFNPKSGEVNVNEVGQYTANPPPPPPPPRRR